MFKRLCIYIILSLNMSFFVASASLTKAEIALAWVLQSSLSNIITNMQHKDFSISNVMKKKMLS